MNVVLQPPPPRRGLGADVNLPPDPQAQYNQYNSAQGQAQIKAQAQTSAYDFAIDIARWAQGGQKPNLPSETNVGAMAAATAIATGNPAIGSAIMLGFAQAALERKVYDALGAPTWAVVGAAILGGDVGSVINLAYGELTSIWGSSGCPQPGPPNCTGGPPPSGPDDPNWKTIQNDCDYVHALWMIADIADIEQKEDRTLPEVQFRYLYDQVLFVMWTAAINCKMPPPSDRDVLYALAAMWNNAHVASSQHTFPMVAIAPGGNWWDPPNPTYLAWVLSGGPSGYNMSSAFGAAPITINTGGMLPPSALTSTGGGFNVGPIIHPGGGVIFGGGAAAPSSTASKVVKATAIAGGGAFAASVIYAFVKKKTIGHVWGRVWNETKRVARTTVRKVKRL